MKPKATQRSRSRKQNYQTFTLSENVKSDIILMYPIVKQHVAVLLLPATVLSGRIWLLAFNLTLNHTFGHVGSGGASEATGCCLSHKAEVCQMYMYLYLLQGEQLILKTLQPSTYLTVMVADQIVAFKIYYI